MRGRKSRLLLLALSWGVLAAAVAAQEALDVQSHGDAYYQPRTKKTSPSNTVIGSMAVMFGRPDWQVGFQSSTPTTSACMQQVQRAADRMGVLKSKATLKLSPYFLYNWVLPADAAPGEDHYYRHNVVRWLVRTGDYTQKEPTKDDVDSFITDFSKCIGTALSLGFKHIFVNPMVDPDYNQPETQKLGAWRNAAEFDPTEVFNNTATNSFPSSYQTLVLRPTLQAVKTALQDFGSTRSKSLTVSFGLGAEQGRSFTVYAAKWEILAKEVQTTLKKMVNKLHVGPHFDPTKLCGYYCDYYSNSTKVTESQWEDFRSLLSTASEFGTSSYPNVWEQYDPASRSLDIAQSARLVDSQLKEFAGTSIQALRRAGKRFIFNELGLGGCQWFGCDGTSTPDIYQLSINAYNGRGSYEDYSNPPNLVDVYRYYWTKAFRMEWWRQHLRFFKRSTSSSLTYCPDAAYIWVVGSWDVAAIYASSSKGFNPDAVGCNPLESYCVPDLVGMIKDFNSEGTVPSRAMFTLPGPAYYQAPSARVRSRAVSAEDVQLPVDLSSVPAWAQPLVFSRPSWG